MWNFRYGLLIERKGSSGMKDAEGLEPLARVFTLRHPSREFYPVISKTQGLRGGDNISLK